MPNGWQGTRRRRTSIADSFEAFLEGWLVRQEHYLDELLSAQQHCHEIREEDLKDLVSCILAHYQEYYEEKSRAAQRDIFLVFSPRWLTTLENAFLWIAGFKPGLAFHLVTNSVNGLTEDQSQRMNRLTQETLVKERALNHELARIQESVAAPPLLAILRCETARRQPADGERSEDGAVLAEWKSALEAVVANADELRTNTVMAVVEILRPAQSISFLTAAAQLQLRIRTLGSQAAERSFATKKSANIPLPPSNTRPIAAVSLAFKVIHDFPKLA